MAHGCQPDMISAEDLGRHLMVSTPRTYSSSGLCGSAERAELVTQITNIPKKVSAEGVRRLIEVCDPPASGTDKSANTSNSAWQVLRSF